MHINNVVVIILVLMLGYGVVGYTQQKSIVQLALSSFSHKENDLQDGTRGSNDATALSPLMSQAIALYEAKEFPAAIGILREYLQENEEDLDATFYLGMAYLADGQALEALPLLAYSQQYDALRSSDATWYLALAHLQMGNAVQAKTLLTSLNEPNSTYQQKANDLLAQL